VAGCVRIMGGTRDVGILDAFRQRLDTEIASKAVSISFAMGTPSSVYATTRTGMGLRSVLLQEGFQRPGTEIPEE
jgi:hypothetical protein